MGEPAAESKAYASGSWSSPETLFTIEYPLLLMDEIRLAVSAALHANLHGGIEGGGVFFGTRIENGARIIAWRPIPRAGIGPVLDQAATDALLNGLHPLGWFLPHARGSLALSETDIGIFNQFFSHGGQFTLVLQPDLVGTTRAAFFVRNQDGALCEHRTGHEFTVEPLRTARVHGRRTASNEPGPAPAPPDPEHRSARVHPGRTHPDRTNAARPETPAPDLVRLRPGRKRDDRQDASSPALAVQAPPASRRSGRWLAWLWVIPITGFLIYAAVVARERLFTEPGPATLSLKLQDWPGAQLHVDWEKDAQPIEIARRGEIVFEDGGKTTAAQLDPAQLRLGSFAYARRSGSVKVKLSIYGDSGAAPAIEEVAEFNGAPPEEPPPSANQDRMAWEKQRADLEAEIKRLRIQIAAENTRKQELEALVRVLENRLRLPPAK